MSNIGGKSAPTINAKTFLSLRSSEDKIKFLLKYAVLAPSTHNTQPWKFRLTPSSCKIFVDPTRRLPEADKLGRDTYISLGILIGTLETVAKAFGVYDKTDITDQKANLVAEVFFRNLDSAERVIDQSVLELVCRRCNYRGPFAKVGLSESSKSNILRSNDPHLVKKLLTDSAEIEKIAGLTRQGLINAYSRKRFRKEIGGWIRNNHTLKKSGIPGYSLRMPTISSYLIPHLMKHVDMGEKLGALNFNSFISSSGVIIFGSKKSDKRSWLATGREFQRTIMILEKLDIVTSIFVAAIEDAKLCPEVKKLAAFDKETQPQFLCCYGRPILPRVYSPRESVETKIIE